MWQAYICQVTSLHLSRDRPTSVTWQAYILALCLVYFQCLLSSVTFFFVTLHGQICSCDIYIFFVLLNMFLSVLLFWNKVKWQSIEHARQGGADCLVGVHTQAVYIGGCTWQDVTLWWDDTPIRQSRNNRICHTRKLRGRGPPCALSTW